MTTDTKAVARWGYDGCMDVVECPDGEYVLLTDYERAVGELSSERDGLIELANRQATGLREATGYFNKLNAELAASRAELAAKSKDAERYRWLQMQSPYRFKKIQDACVIDSVDVLYFKADRFNELLDAAMGDGNGR